MPKPMRLKASDYIYSYKELPFIRTPHNPKWSFVASKECAKANYQWRNKMDGDKCAVQCNECREICEFNDYIRGMPNSPPNYPMPAIRTELDYYRDWPTNNVVAVVLFNVSDPNIPCLEFWH